MSDGLETLILDESPRERGVRHGEVFAEAIGRNLDRYLSKYDYYGVDPRTARKWAERFIPLIEDANPEYADEIRGVADGSGISLTDVTLLNARYEIMYGIWAEQAKGVAQRGPPLPDGCTSFAVQGDVTADGRPYMGQNWDWIHDVEVFLMDVRPDDKPNHVAVTEAGIVGGKIGVNEHGIGLTLNGLVTTADGEHPFRKPYHVRFREILSARRLSEAIEPVISTDRACSANLLLGSPEGEFIDIESLPESATYLSPEDGLLVHANHLLGGTRTTSRFERLLPDTLCRAPRLRRLLENRSGDLSRERIQEILRDHFNCPASICRHVDEERPALERSATRTSVIIDPTGRRLFATDGPPCKAPYVEYAVSR
ncbi:C45 family autoproteolytic acyltransferase/hydrolase [Halomarina halobia]|uniref:C45 family autoproteolytic acyltransferase/hydrolase n=1 Tax=Halomarina halobia TaxID=3033386 RepID=A0ABD6AG37_9EURY|nr:C45 family peptidase [Halomarina sp. PSR21]